MILSRREFPLTLESTPDLMPVSARKPWRALSAKRAGFSFARFPESYLSGNSMRGNPMLPQMLEDRYIQAGNLKTRYWALGDKGSPVILIHGLGASAEIWMYNIEALARQHRVLVPDLPGFGRSDQPGPSFSPFDYTSFLDAFMKALRIEKGSLVGQSLGGGIALHAALRLPQKVEKLVLVDSAGLGTEVIWTLKLMSLPLAGEILCRPSRIGLRLFFKLAVRDQNLITEDFIELYYQFLSRPGFQEFFLRILRQVVDLRGAREEILNPIMNHLQDIAQPVLIVWGEKDRVLPLKHGFLGRERLPRARLQIMEGCGHIPFFERAAEFNRLVFEFLSE
jgi:pimeloyl-ACP methyl ester carboxylesterase